MPHLADIIIPGQHFGISSERSAAAEAFVMMTLGILFVLLALFGLAAWVLWRRYKYPEPHRQLLIELEAESAPRTQPKTTPDEEPKSELKSWEREADWWKQ